MAGSRPLVIVIAGPNGAGKSTTAPSLLRGARNPIPEWRDGKVRWLDPEEIPDLVVTS